MPSNGSTNGRKQPAGSGFARGSTLLITNAGKVLGLYIALNEAVLRDEAQNSVIALAAILVLGAQVVENVVLNALDRFFGNARGGGES